MEENLVHHNLDFLKILGRYTLDSKMLVCQKYSSRIMSRSMVDLNKACEENIMPWEIAVSYTHLTLPTNSLV